MKKNTTTKGSAIMDSTSIWAIALMVIGVLGILAIRDGRWFSTKMGPLKVQVAPQEPQVDKPTKGK